MAPPAETAPSLEPTRQLPRDGPYPCVGWEVGCVRAAARRQARRRDRLPGVGSFAGVRPLSGGVHTWVATELLHVASPASGARVRGPPSAGAGSPRVRGLAPRWVRDVRAACRGNRTLPPPARARPGPAGRP